jgi:hypothetical protein
MAGEYISFSSIGETSNEEERPKNFEKTLSKFHFAHYEHHRPPEIEPRPPKCKIGDSPPSLSAVERNSTHG